MEKYLLNSLKEHFSIAFLKNVGIDRHVCVDIKYRYLYKKQRQFYENNLLLYNKY